MNIGVHIYLFELVFSFSFDKYLKVELLGCMVVLFLVYLGTSILFPQWLHQFTFPQTVYKCSLFTTSSPTFVICVLFDDSHSDKNEVISHCGFDLHFSDDRWCWASFHVSVDHLYVFGKMSLWVLCSFLNWIVWGFFFWCWVVRILCIFWILTPYWICVLLCFLHIHFHSPWLSLCSHLHLEHPSSLLCAWVLPVL